MIDVRVLSFALNIVSISFFFLVQKIKAFFIKIGPCPKLDSFYVIQTCYDSILSIQVYICI